MPYAQVEEECRRHSSPGNVVSVSCINTQDQTVISGNAAAVGAVEKALANTGARTVSLNVSAPFHCQLMASAAQKLKEELAKYQYQDPFCQVIANASAAPYSSGAEILPSLTRQMTEPVLWEQSMRYLAGQRPALLVEVGPGMALRNMMRRIEKSITALSCDNAADLQTVKAQLPSREEKPMSNPMPSPTPRASGGNPDKMKLLTRCLGIAVCTRNTNWDNEEYERGVIEPYKKIEQLVDELERNKQEPSLEQAKAGLEMLQSVFRTKRCPPEEQAERFQQLFAETNTGGLFPDFSAGRK
jgi:[acyl-carrier-protein] S-malonyltransferase